MRPFPFNCNHTQWHHALAFKLAAFTPEGLMQLQDPSKELVICEECYCHWQ